MGVELDLKKRFSEILHLWWLVVAMGLIGGVIGWVFATSNPPIYEANAAILVGVDYTSVNRNYWTDSKSDFVNNRSSLLVNSDDVKETAITQLDLGGAMIEKSAFSLQKRSARWDLVVQHEDPEIAANAANAWQDAAINALVEAHQFSVEALRIGTELEILIKCSSVESANQFCEDITSGLDLQAKIAELTEELDLVEEQSRGISIILTFERGEQAVKPSEPVINNRNVLVFSGLLLGLLIGILLINLRADQVNWRKG